MARGKRYFSADDDERGVTPSRLKRLSKNKQREYLLNWFYLHYEDPANETPYNSQEGGYLYVWGGPYDAREELDEEFGSLVSESVIESVVDEVESDGLTDWAPGRHHSDHQRAADEYYEENRDRPGSPADPLEQVIKELEGGVIPSFGDAAEIAARQTISSDIDKILQALPPQPPAGMGHNNPPLDDESTAQDAIAEIREASASVKSQVDKQVPDALETARAAYRLQKAADWIGRKIDTAAEGFAKEFGGALGKLSAAAIVGTPLIAALGGWSNLKSLINTAAEHVSQWLAQVISMF